MGTVPANPTNPKTPLEYEANTPADPLARRWTLERARACVRARSVGTVGTRVSSGVALCIKLKIG